jgi:hypothetical protein
MMTDYNLSPSIFVMILTTQLIRDISLNSFKFAGVLTLGTKIMKELLMA